VPRADTGRRYLVFVRAGRESWHRRLILEDPDRNWDCCVNWYEAPEQEDLGRCARSARSWANGLFGGLKLGAGAVIRGVREGDNSNDYSLPGFVRFNVMAAYAWRAADTRMSIQLNVDNLLDKRYFESLSGTRTVMPGEPRRWIGSLRVEF
jgi:outer membrane receptor for monomeric catechols